MLFMVSFFLNEKVLIFHVCNQLLFIVLRLCCIFHCFNIAVRSLFCYAVLCIISSFAIISLVMIELLLSSGYHMAVIILCLFLTVPWVLLH